MQGSTQPDGTRAELYVRSLLPDGHTQQQAAVIDRLQGLSDTDALSDVSVQVIGRQIPSTPAEARTELGLFALNRVSVFQEWAKRNGCSLEPAFQVRSVDSEISGEQYRALVFPVQLLAEYAGSELKCVTPHTTDGETVTVMDRLTMIEGEEESTFASLERASAARPPAQSELSAADTADEDSDPPLPE
ncbi:HTH domain-containing protein [Haloarcula sp. CBA1127]|uniref:HTH domain-containing protein n=1 Tax=Haloarcula sp. CBA1127 TaxID=1765055 RepID=UPI00073E46CD|nr:HTH domain-containing protein [Haloarcula sp. CBA1127]